MQEKRTIHQILLDASGSMEPSADTAIDTCAALLERFRTEADRQTGTGVLVGLALFEETARALYSDRHPGEATLPDPAGFPGTGSSALFDAFHDTVVALEAGWRESRERLPTRVCVHTVTDGIDTASVRFTAADMLRQVERLVATGEWEFRFHGTDLDTLVSDALTAIRKRYRLPEEKDLLCRALCAFFADRSQGKVPARQED